MQHPLPDWVKALLAVNTALLVAAISTGAAIAWKNESRLAVVENGIVGLQSGDDIKMARETKSEFDAVHRRLDDLMRHHEELSAIVRLNGERLSRLEGAVRMPARKDGATREGKIEEREALPNLTPRPPHVAPGGLGG